MTQSIEGKNVSKVAETKSDPVEILWDLASTGQIDPWDVDILDATDRFLSALDAMDREGLTRSARCLFYAAALVNMKARVLSEGSASWGMLEEEIEDEWEDDGFDLGFRRRPDRPLFYPRRSRDLKLRDRKPRGRSLTLDDLIDALRRLDARAMMAEPEYDDGDDFDPWDIEFGEEDNEIPTAHEDDMEGDLVELRDLLRPAFADKDAKVPLDDLVNERMAKGDVYRALLFMYREGEVELDQEEFYGPMTVSPGPEALHELSEDEIQKLKQRRGELETATKRRAIPRPGARRGRRLSRRPGLAAPAHTRRPRPNRRRSAQALDDMIRTPAGGPEDNPAPADPPDERVG